MKELFVEGEEKTVEIAETGKTEDLKHWWMGRSCTFCGSQIKLWISGNGIVRCEKHYKTNT